jgi:hypothetical protein
MDGCTWCGANYVPLTPGRWFWIKTGRDDGNFSSEVSGQTEDRTQGRNVTGLAHCHVRSITMDWTLQHVRSLQWSILTSLRTVAMEN